MSKAVSVYVSGARGTSEQRRKPLAGLLALLFAFFALASGLNLLPGASPPVSSPVHASAITVCSDKSSLGAGFDQGDWSTYAANYALPAAKNRTWTLQEAFGGNTKFPTYEGEGDPKGGTFFGAHGVGSDRVKDYSQLTARKSQLETYRDANNCIWNRAGNSTANLGFTTATLFVSITQFIAVKAFDPSFICSKVDSTNCINIVKIVGGDSSGGGIISALRNSVYMPLLVIVVFLSACWIGWTGMKHHKTREALWGVVWVCLSVVFGLMFLLKPMMLAQAPMTVGNTISGCIIGAFNGDNCMNNTSSGDSALSTTGSTSTDICKSAVSTSASGDMTMAVSGLSCSIWKAFVLEPWSQATFRKSFQELDTKDTKNTVVRAAIEKAGAKPEDFCVNVSTSGSVNDYKGLPLSLDGTSHKVCNLAAYQLFLLTKATTTETPTKVTASTDPKTAATYSQNNEAPQALWYKYMNVLAADNGLWSAWAPTSGNVSFHNQIAAITWVTAGAGSVILGLTALMALVYYLIMAISVSLAPLFFLAMVHPTRGKKLFLGWVEIMGGNLFKYLTSALFLILAIAFYAAILGSVDNIYTTAIIVAIVSVALWVYRKEIINLLGRANMGGEKLSNGMEQWMNKRATKAKRVGVAAVGASIGTVAANGGYSTGFKSGLEGMKDSWAKSSENTNTFARIAKAAGSGVKESTLDVADNFNPKHVGEALAGAKDGATSQLKRGNGIMANVARERARIEQDAKRDLGSQVDAAKNKERLAADRFNSLRQTATQTDRNVQEKSLELQNANAAYTETTAHEEHFQTVRVNLLADIANKDALLASVFALQAQASNLSNQATIARALGTEEGLRQADDYDRLALVARNKASSMQSTWIERMDSQGIDGKRQFNTERDNLTKDLQGAMAAYMGNEGDYDAQTYVTNSIALNSAKSELTSAITERDAVFRDLNEANEEQAVAARQHESLRLAHEKLGPGKHVTPDQVKQLLQDSTEITLKDAKEHLEEVAPPQSRSVVTPKQQPLLESLAATQDLSAFANTVRAEAQAEPLNIGMGTNGASLPQAPTFQKQVQEQRQPESRQMDRPGGNPSLGGGTSSAEAEPPLVIGNNAPQGTNRPESGVPTGTSIPPLDRGTTPPEQKNTPPASQGNPSLGGGTPSTKTESPLVISSNAPQETNRPDSGVPAGTSTPPLDRGSTPSAQKDTPLASQGNPSLGGETPSTKNEPPLVLGNNVPQGTNRPDSGVPAGTVTPPLDRGITTPVQEDTPLASQGNPSLGGGTSSTKNEPPLVLGNNAPQGTNPPDNGVPAGTVTPPLDRATTPPGPKNTPPASQGNPFAGGKPFGDGGDHRTPRGSSIPPLTPSYEPLDPPTPEGPEEPNDGEFPQ